MEQATYARRGGPQPDREALPGESYAYLLGIYLGDGHVARLPRSYALRIYCDVRYPGIVARTVDAIQAVMPGRSVTAKDIQIARRDAVRALDAFVGPKR